MAEKTKIVVVDDDGVNRLLLKMTLSEYEVTTAANGSEMWSVLKKDHPSLILLDVEMPGEDGFEIARQLSKREDTQDIPIIFVTARDAGKDVEDGFRFGGYDYVKKPFDKMELRARVRAAMDKKRHEIELQKRSITDPLTGVYNRRHLIEKGAQMIEYALRSTTVLAVAMIDLDCLKSINDTYGHHAGDAALRLCAETINRNIRPYDLLARYGGDEFVVMFVESDKRSAKRILSRIKDELNSSAIEYGDMKISCTFSGGVAEINDVEDGDVDITRLIELADKRMYTAKSSGRNRIVD